MDKVCVLMSTYNGGPFLEEQINSILNQEGVELHLVVRDDGSSDNTLDILECYKKKGLLEYSFGENLGYAGSFLRLLQNAPQCDYYAFSDQDDIWLKDKMYQAILCLKANGNSRQLYCSNLYIYQNNRVLGLMRPHKNGTNRYKCLNESICTGCTIVIDNSFREFVMDYLPMKVYVHDLWMFHTAVFLGNFIYDDNAYILYRQHGDNQIGAKFTRSAKLRSRMKSLKTLPYQHERENETKLFIKTYAQLLSYEDLDILNKVADYNSSLLKKISLLFDNRYNTSFFDKARILLGVY